VLPWHYPRVTDWRAVLAEDDAYELCPGATEVAVHDTEALPGAVFPAGLRTLYLASDGVLDKPSQWFVVWSLAEVVTRNQRAYADECAARQGLVGLGDDGTGAPFCLPRDGGVGVFVWQPIEQQACWLADFMYPQKT
jgi:cell wall assembly regulator SMI1